MPTQRKIIAELTRLGLPTTFNGRDVDKWSVKQLRKFIGVFGHETARVEKLDREKLCIKLGRVKPAHLTNVESDIIAKLVSQEIEVSDARDQLSIANTSADLMCEICSSPKTPADFPTLPAATNGIDGGHTHRRFTTCVTCLEQHIVTQSGTVATLDCIVCPELECKATLDINLMQYAPASIFDRYNGFLTKKAEQVESPSITCANLTCQTPIPLPIPDPDAGPPIRRPSNVSCPKCTLPTCVYCGTPTHLNQDHKQSRTRLRRSMYNEIHTAAVAINSSVSTNTKPCPNPECLAILHWNGDKCPNARCLSHDCGLRFCWHCEQPIQKGGACQHKPGKECATRLKRLAKRYAEKRKVEISTEVEMEDGKVVKKTRKTTRTRGKEAYLMQFEDGMDMVKGEDDE
jgi:hypothetical protein